jgi:predicted NodU family carbamoyl transferase
MAASGDSSKYYSEVSRYLNGLLISKNLHKGVIDWTANISSKQAGYDLAASVQQVFEEQVERIMTLAKTLTQSNNLVYMGGCAFNRQANLNVVHHWNGIWSLPNPGDASSAIGAVLYHTKQHINWPGPLAKHIAIKV